ncbi:MAG TPA: hypothetical protein VJN94_14595 [Candidatus Binataceae bacterium]|nr:hypothetical protein [Candidatus Binataceae bacterium]
MAAHPPVTSPHRSEIGGAEKQAIARSDRAIIRRIAAVSAAFLIALVLLGQGITAPFTKDAEPQSAQWIVDIVDHGNWLVQYDYYHVVNPKPPLFYWLAAIGAKATGAHVDEVNARAVSLLAGAILAAEVMAWSAIRLGSGGGWLAFAFLLGSYGYASRATTALTDMLMTLLLFSAYFVAMPLVEGEVSPWRTVATGVLLGLAILAKGPVTLVLFGLAILIYLLLRRENPLRYVMRPWPWVTLAIALAIAACWYVPAFAYGRSSDFAGVFIRENLGHFMPASAGGTGEAARPFYYIVTRTIDAALPLSLLIPALIFAMFSSSFATNASRGMLYQLAMLLAVILLFSLASAKRDDYVLPALPPMAIVFAGLFAGRSDKPEAQSESEYAANIRDFTVATIAFAMLAGTLAIFAYMKTGGGIAWFGTHLQSSDASYAAIFAYGLARFSPALMGFVLAMIAGASVCCAGLWYRRSLITGAGLAIICIAGTVLWTGTMRPAEAATRTLATFAAEVRARVGADPAIYVAHDNPGFAWYYGGTVPALPLSAASSPIFGNARIYFVGRPGDLALLAPPIRRRMSIVIQSHVLGGGGPPALYVIGPSR